MGLTDYSKQRMDISKPNGTNMTNHREYEVGRFQSSTCALGEAVYVNTIDTRTGVIVKQETFQTK